MITGQNVQRKQETGPNDPLKRKPIHQVKEYIRKIRSNIQKEKKKKEYKINHCPYSKRNLFEQDDQEFFIHGKYNPKCYSEPSKSNPKMSNRRRKIHNFSRKELHYFIGR